MPRYIDFQNCHSFASIYPFATEMKIMENEKSIQECPLCGCSEFRDFRGRIAVQCTNCKSLPRGRSSFLLIQKLVRLNKQSRVAHFAPELGLSTKLFGICGHGYEAYDFHPPRYQERINFTEIRKCDLCNDIDTFEKGSYDVVLHNHVMEHVPCNYAMVLRNLQTLLKPGGVQIFSVPITRGYTAANYSPALSKEERTRMFAQFDHFVKFGALDHDQHLGMVFGHTSESYSLDKVLDESELVRANIPRQNWYVEGGAVLAAVKE